MTSERTASPGLGSLGSGAVTALGLAVQQGLAAIVGIVIAREFGRGAETDGFFAAYGLFVVLALAATALRAVLLPPLARARQERRLGRETAAYVVPLGAFSVALVVVVTLAAETVASVITGFDDGAARDTAASALPWLMVAAAGQLLAGLAASALAALDDYVTAALSYAGSSALGLALILWRVPEDGIDAVAWGIALNAALVAAVPFCVLFLRARREAMPVSAVIPERGARTPRLGGLAAGVAFPLALQAVYLVCLPLAADEGVGAVTSLGYAYLAGSAVVAVTASALALVTSVPLTRTGLDPARVALHVDSSAWLALVAVGATAGIFAVAGEVLADAVLGAAYGSEVGAELGRYVVALAPWMVVAVGVSVTFPLMFVANRGKTLPLIALLVIGLHLPLAWLGASVGGVYGLALALALSTAAGLAAMLASLGSLVPTLAGLAVAAVRVGATAVVSFTPGALVLGPLPAALLGLAAYAALLALFPPAALTGSWRYLRALT